MTNSLLVLRRGADVLASELPDQDTKDQTKPQETVVEPRTGLQVPTAVLGHTLVGTSARSVTFLRFLTYAFALYRDPKKWSSKDTSTVLPGVIADPAGSTLRIVTYRAIDSTHFCSSINAGAVPRMKKVLESQNMDASKAHEQAEEVGRAFRAIFKTKDLPSNTAVDFHISRPNPKSSDTRVTVFINGTQEGHIDGPLFTNALVALYFGNEPRAQEIQSGVQAHLEKVAALKH